MNTEELRTFCMKLPGVTEEIKWGHDLCFMIGEKMFCVTGLESDHSVSLKADAEKFEELILEDGIVPAPYLARYKWVNIGPSATIKRKELEALIERSYQLVKEGLSKKKLTQLGL